MKRGLAGLFPGGLIGWFPAHALLSRGILGTFLIGALMGIATRWLAGGPHKSLAIISGLSALVMSVICMGTATSFSNDPSMRYFLPTFIKSVSGHGSISGSERWSHFSCQE